MAAGRKFHWKHGWIPVSAEAKKYAAGQGPKPIGGGNTKARAAAASAALVREAEARRGQSGATKFTQATRMIARFQGMFGSYGTPPITKAEYAVEDNRAFVYDPRDGTFKTVKRDASPPDLNNPIQIKGLVGMTGDRRVDLGSTQSNDKTVSEAMNSLIREREAELNGGANIGGRPIEGGGYELGTTWNDPA